MSFDELKVITLKYKNIEDLENRENNIYKEICEKGFFEEMTKHMRKHQRKLSDGDIEIIAKQFTTRQEFRKNDSGAYTSARKRGILNDVCKHMETKLHLNKTKEDVQKVALKYDSRMSFKNSEDRWAYNKAVREKYIDEVCSHMEGVGNNYKRCVYVYEFTQYKTCYVGLTYSLKKRHLQHSFGDKSSVREFCLKNNIEIVEPKKLTDYIDKNKASELEKIYVEKYKNDGWNILNKATAGGLGGRTDSITYTKDVCKELAKKFNNIKDFAKKYGTAYKHVLLNKWQDYVFSHIDRNKIKKDFKDKVRIKNGRKVKQYNLDFKLVATFNSISEASEKTNISVATIKRSCKSPKRNYLSGYIFRYENDGITEEFKREQKEKAKNGYLRKSKMVCMLDNNKNIIRTFNNMTEAAKFVKRDRSSINKVCGKNKKCAGYFWSYKVELK